MVNHLAIRGFAVFLLGATQATLGFASDLTARARIDSSVSGAAYVSSDVLEIGLGLSNSIPYRVFVLANPNRIVFDFQDIDSRGIEPDTFLVDDAISDIRFGVFQPGWSRIVLDVEKPFVLQTATLDTSAEMPKLTATFEAQTQNNFDLAAGAVYDGRWTREVIDLPDAANPERLAIAIDPGHGGVDPGAVRENVMEKDLVLQFSKELAEMIRASGAFDVFLTRETDKFVSLDERVRIARNAGADLFLSIHVNTVTFGNASGASVNTLSERASDVASAKLAELENRADLSSGVDALIEEDNVARILVDMARVETNERSKNVAETLLTHMRDQIRVLRSKPHRSAGFRVLKAHDIPSVLVELGFMSNETDRANIQSENWRKDAALAILNAIDAWVVEDATRATLLMK